MKRITSSHLTRTFIHPFIHSFRQCTVQAALCKHSNTTDVNLPLYPSLFSTTNSIHSEPMLSKNLWSVWMRPKKKRKKEKINPLQKVFTLHYWRFFWFKYLFSLFCITLICLWSRLLGNIMLETQGEGGGAEARVGEGGVEGLGEVENREI